MRIRSVALLCIWLLGCDDDSGTDKAAPGTVRMTLDGVERTSVSAPVKPYAYLNTAENTIDITAFFQNESNPDLFSTLGIKLHNAKKGFDILLDDPFRWNNSVIFYNSESGDGYVSVFADGIVGTVFVYELDLSRNLISGTFEVEMATSDKSKKIIITAGSFTKIPIQK